MLFDTLQVSSLFSKRTCWMLLIILCSITWTNQNHIQGYSDIRNPAHFAHNFIVKKLPTVADESDDDEEDDDYPPGVVATYSLGDQQVQRFDTEIAFDWQAESPDARLPKGKFSANWQAQLLIKEATKYRFHVFVAGTVEILVEGKSVLKEEQKQAGWVSGQLIELGFGEKELEVRYHKTGDHAVIKIFWSGDTFEIEPLPVHQLFRETGFAQLKRIEKGQKQFLAFRCNRCHQRENELISKPSPALLHFGIGTDVNWLASKIRSLPKKKTHRKMPSFDFSKDEAKAVAAFLIHNRKETKLLKLPKVNKKAPKDEVTAGRLLVQSKGCLACHTVGELGTIGLFGGNNLSHEGDKRSREWIYTWLKEPHKLNKDHHMPTFRMSNTQRRQLSAYLASLGKPFDSKSPSWVNNEEKISLGKKLVRQANCAACHTIPNVKANKQQLTDLSKPITDWSHSCLAEKNDLSKGRPVYHHIDKKAMKEFLTSQVGSRSPLSQFEQGKRTLLSRNCLACHKRGSGLGITKTAGQVAALEESYHGKSHGMIPPSLSAVGDKLKDESLAEWVSGEYKDSRLPWLTIGMPRFKHSKADKAALLHYLKANDRIPANPPLHGDKPVPLPSDTQTLVLGHSLVGPNGFSCIACHTIGDYTPKNTAPGTRGAQLMMIGNRVRKEFFMRWCRSPLRVVPGIEMPGYKKPVQGVLKNNSDWQIETVWKALNNPKFKPPTNPSVVEQFFTVKAGDPPRIVRDVFTNPKENRSKENNNDETIPRSLAIGFGNKHNVLYDLSVMSIRQWTVGDFARQRAAGKSWFWDMAGLPVMQGFEKRSDYALQKEGEPNSKLIFPTSKNDQVGRLLGYKLIRKNRIELSYSINFKVNSKVKTVFFTEEVSGLKSGDRGHFGGINRAYVGIKRGIKFKNVPDGFKLVFIKPNANTSLGKPEIEIPSVTIPIWSSTEWDKVTSMKSKNKFHLVSRSDDHFHVLYHVKVNIPKLVAKPIKVEPIPIEKVTSLPGYDGVRLPIDRSIMPTAMTFTSKGKLAFTSLKGHVYIAEDSNGDGVQDKLTLFEEGLASPYGILSDGDDLIVCHKPEILRLRDTNGDGRADVRTVIATGWGYNDNYHDWTCGLVRDRKGNLYFCLGSDYAQSKRPLNQQRWRGKVIRLAPDGKMTPIAHAFRYPTGTAMDHKERLFASDQQGVQNCFNEINYVQKGKFYGVWSQEDQRIKPQPSEEKPAVQIPHDWTRSVNGLFFLPPKNQQNPLFAGHGIGCEYNHKFLIRFTNEEVRGVLQGATYAFSKKAAGAADDNFYGPLCGVTAPNGDIYIGSIADSGWSGGQNNGRIVRLRANGKIPNGIKEINVKKDGFKISFTQPINKQAAALINGYSLSGYTRVWQGGYATPDSGRHKVTVQSVDIAEDGMSLQLHVTGLKEGHVYEVSCANIGTEKQRTLFPATGYYTLHKLPKE